MGLKSSLKMEKKLQYQEDAQVIFLTKLNHTLVLTAINKQRNLVGRFLILVILLLTISLSGYSQTINLQHFSTKNGLPSNNCYYTLQDSKGYIWVATDAGVSRFDGKIFETFSIDDGLPD